MTIEALDYAGVMRCWVCGLTCLVLVAACGDTEDERTGKVAPNEHANASHIPTVDDFLAAYAKVVCQVGEACGSERLRYGSGAECEVQFGALLHSFAPFELPTIQYDATQGAKCLEALGSLTCDDIGSVVALAFADCANVYYGSGVAGAECSSGLECGPGLLCDAQSCPGKCTVAPGEGGPCLGYSCAQGMSCVGVGGPMQRCERLGVAGAACGEDVRGCELGLVCDESGGAGVCRTYQEVYPRASLGQSCLRDSQCDGTAYCVRSAESTAGTCAERILAGGTCPGGSSVECAGQQYCTSREGAGLCAPRVGLGEECVDDYGCATGDCVKNACRFLNAVGETCADDDECYSLSCVDGVCGVLQVCTLTQ